MKLKTRIRKARFFGRRYRCPMCDSGIRKLRPYGFSFPVLEEKNVVGGGYRLNAQCPVCKSTDRERLLYLYLSKRTDIESGQLKLLHIAPEPGLSAYLKRLGNIDYLSADINPGKAMVRMDITAIDYSDESFDVIICNHVLEHIIDDASAMAELHRVLKSGGWGILQVPVSLSLDSTYEDASITAPEEREKAFGQSDHVRIYARDYRHRLAAAGFRVKPFEWWLEPDFSASENRYGLLRDETLYVVEK